MTSWVPWLPNPGVMPQGAARSSYGRLATGSRQLRVRSPLGVAVIMLTCWSPAHAWPPYFSARGGTTGEGRGGRQCEVKLSFSLGATWPLCGNLASNSGGGSSSACSNFSKSTTSPTSLRRTFSMCSSSSACSVDGWLSSRSCSEPALFHLLSRPESSRPSFGVDGLTSFAHSATVLYGRPREAPVGARRDGALFCRTCWPLCCSRRTPPRVDSGCLGT